METPVREKSARELVKEKHPSAHVIDDGESIRIYLKKKLDSKCPNCHQRWEREEIDNMACIGSGGTESRAWENAARSLSLVKG